MTNSSRNRARRPPRRPVLQRLASLALLALVTQACGALGFFSFGGQMKLTATTVPDMNANAPVAVELLIFFDADLLAQAMALSAAEWFGDKGAQFVRDHPAGGNSYQSHRWEWVPGQSPDTQTIRFGGGPKGALLFANYFTSGDHRAAIDSPRGSFRLQLQTAGFTLEPLG